MRIWKQAPHREKIDNHFWYLHATFGKKADAKRWAEKTRKNGVPCRILPRKPGGVSWVEYDVYTR